MAVVSTLSNRFKYQLASGNIDFDADTFKLILMNTTFAFDKDSDDNLGAVTADQLSTGNGYTQDSATLASVSVTRDDANDKTTVTWDDYTFTASGGSIGPSGAAIIYDDTTSDDTVLGCIDFGSDLTATDGLGLQIKDIVFELS